MTHSVEYNQDYTDKQKNRSFLRQIIRRVYFNNIRQYVKGRAIDFGCGIGTFLEFLSNDSIGLEVNKDSVKLCQQKNINVFHYLPEEDDFKLSMVKKGHDFQSFVSLHVFEHIPDSQTAIKKIFESCWELGILRVVVVVPGRKWYDWGAAGHLTFIDTNYIKNNNIDKSPYYRLYKTAYFPLPFRWAGKYFTHNETIFVFDRKK